MAPSSSSPSLFLSVPFLPLLRPNSSLRRPYLPLRRPYVFSIFSFFNNCITQSFTVNSLFNGIIDGPQPRICSLLEIFGFDFIKIRFMHFGNPLLYMRPFTLFLGVVASVCSQNYPHTKSTCWSMINTCLRVYLTHKHVQFTSCPLWCSASASDAPLMFDAIV